jgi:hypothetical protein
MAAEGTGASQLAQVISELGYNEYDRFEIATVTSITPTKIKIDGMNIEMDAHDLVISGHLVDRTLTATSITGTNAGSTMTLTNCTLNLKSPLNVGDRVIVASMSNGQMYVVLDKAVMI